MFCKENSSTILFEDLCIRFSLREIQKATNNFNGSLIVGACCKVYKGNINGTKGTLIVAIKRFETTSQGHSEFENEINLICQLHHPHLVPLIGFCADQNERILVYDYMPSRLYDHLHIKETSNIEQLSWKRRLEICIGIARGSHYLHSGTKCIIIHHDVRTNNIFWDEKWVAKIADFGISKKAKGEISKGLVEVKSNVKDTLAYADPEYVHIDMVTEKSDVYSFGAVLLEIVSAKPAYNIIGKLGDFDEIIDPFLRGKIATECWKAIIDIMGRCLHEQGIERPTMGEVKEQLEYALQLQQRANAIE